MRLAACKIGETSLSLNARERAMSPRGSVSCWLGQLKGGDPVAAQQLWERYFRQLVGLARMRMQGVPKRAADEEDVAVCAFASFYRGVEAGRFPRLDDRDDLWRVLVTLTARKASRMRRHEGQQKRTGAVEASEEDLDAIIGAEPTPAFAAEAADVCRFLLERLADETLMSVAQLKMEGWTNEEIARKLACTPRTIERKL